MIQTNYLCEEHQSQITNICTEAHPCQDRRLCVQCVFKTHSTISREKLPLIDDFLISLNEKLKYCQELNQKPILKLIEKTIAKINDSFQQIKNLVNYLIDQIKSADSLILQLKEKSKHTPIQGFPKSEINFIVKILNNNFDNVKEQERKQIFQKSLIKIQESCNMFIEKLFNWTDVYSKNLQDGLKLQGMMKDCLKHGDFYYIFQDGSKEFAGSYEQGIKKGIWKNYFNKGQDGVIDWQIVNYSNGEKIEQLNSERANIYYKISIGKNPNGVGQLNAEGQKQGDWLENFTEYKGMNYCYFYGEYQKGIRKGNWVTQFKDQIIGGGTYDEQGFKNGFWTDLHECFKGCNQITNSGTYQNGLKTELWSTEYLNEKIGGGMYDKGIKIGNWIELDECFSMDFQVTYSGEYKNQMRVGKWSIQYLRERIGGGMYNENGIKVGLWTENDGQQTNNKQVKNERDGVFLVSTFRFSFETRMHKFADGSYHDKLIYFSEQKELNEPKNKDSLIMYLGEYQNGVRVKQWSIIYKNNEIGGGIYNENGLKMGYWTDPHECFSTDYQITYSGSYENGVKVGQWETAYEKKPIGGGIYDKRGIKISQWIELDQNYSYFHKITYIGKYKNGVRVGAWETILKNKSIGGGSYNENGVKIGYWNDLDQHFSIHYQMTFSGLYENGMKVGQWNTVYGSGGGIYDKKGTKIDKWTDFDERYKDSFKMTYSGKYMNGVRVGKWETTYNNNLIGGGTYDEKGIKIDQWSDFDEHYGELLFQNYDYDFQMTYQGKYQNGVRVGKWKTLYQDQTIGGGFYDEKGIKIGQWTDFDNRYRDHFQMTYSGKYYNGMRIGKWAILFNNIKMYWNRLYSGGGTYDNKEMKHDEWAELDKDYNIGGGEFNEKGIKNGYWREPDDDDKEISFSGKYLSGVPVGQWSIVYKNEIIGGGFYDENGIKIGYWADVSQLYSENQQVSYSGEYKNGIRVGKWSILFNKNQIGGGTYDELGIKNGQWTELDSNYRNDYQKIFSGEYKLGIKVGSWSTLLNNEKMSFVAYDENGETISSSETPPCNQSVVDFRSEEEVHSLRLEYIDFD